MITTLVEKTICRLPHRRICVVEHTRKWPQSGHANHLKEKANKEPFLRVFWLCGGRNELAMAVCACVASRNMRSFVLELLSLRNACVMVE